jgi:DNA-binding response OmpR family regulator
MARILIIDDNETLLLILTEFLAAAGYVVTTAKDGRTGLKLLREEPPDLVITDIFMPDQDGLGVAAALRKEYPTVPLIAMSGDTVVTAFYSDLIKRLGARSVLHKPFKSEQLLAAVAAALAKSE